jgi:type VI secretion system secreted protein Hcp
MFLKFEKINGESTDKTYANTIDILSWSWGASQSGTTHMGPGAGAGKVDVQDITFSKYVDRSSPTLLNACFTGDHIPTATFIARKAGGAAVEYIKIVMTQVLVSSVSTGGSGGEERLTETVTLNFASFALDYTPQDAKGAAQAKVPFAWDIAKNVAG